MKTLIRSRLTKGLLLAGLMSLGTAQDAWALGCSSYVSTGRYQTAWVGHLEGTATVKLKIGYKGSGFEMTIEIGTYTDYDGTTIRLRCDTYQPWFH